MEKSVCYLARPGFMVREVAGETMLIPIDTGNVYLTKEQKLPAFNGMIRLNALGLFLWKQLESPRTVEELAAAVEEHFDADGQDIQADIEAFLSTGIRNQVVFLVAKKENS